MRISLVFCTLTALAAVVAGQCGKRAPSPVDPAVLGKKLLNSGGCSPGGATSSSALRIESWGIFWQPLHSGAFGDVVCPEEIVSLFIRRDMPAMLLWRPATRAKAFQKSHPAQYALFVKDRSGQFLCATVPVQKIAVWGPRRALFKSLVAKMVSGIRASRDLDCILERGPPPTSVKDIERVLARHIVANNALTYLYSLAFSNFFCV